MLMMSRANAATGRQVLHRSLIMDLETELCIFAGLLGCSQLGSPGQLNRLLQTERPLSMKQPPAQCAQEAAIARHT
jgi:hypothetical protein